MPKKIMNDSLEGFFISMFKLSMMILGISVAAAFLDLIFKGIFNFLMTGILILMAASFLSIGIILLLASFSAGKIINPAFGFAIAVFDNYLSKYFEKKGMNIFTFMNAFTAYIYGGFFLLFMNLPPLLLGGLFGVFSLNFEFLTKIWAFYAGYSMMLAVFIGGSAIAFSALCAIRALINSVFWLIKKSANFLNNK